MMQLLTYLQENLNILNYYFIIIYLISKPPFPTGLRVTYNMIKIILKQLKRDQPNIKDKSNKNNKKAA